MKTTNTILKILTAVATIAGAVYIIATYGEQIVAWAKDLLNAMPKCGKSEPTLEEDFDDVEIHFDLSAEAEEPAAEESFEEPAPAEEAPAAEVEIPANEPVAEEADFAE